MVYLGAERIEIWNDLSIEQHGGAAIRKTGALMVGRAPPIDLPQYLAALGRRAGSCALGKFFLSDTQFY